MTYRYPGRLIPFELAILTTIARLQEHGAAASHGSELVHHLPDQRNPDGLVRSGAIYRTLARLAAQGLLQTWTEEPAPMRGPHHQPRRMYRLTAMGLAVLADPSKHPPPRGW